MAYENPYVMDPKLARDPRHNRTQEQAAMGRAAQGLGAQQNALGMYEQAALGQGPSVAELQMRQGGDQAIANAAAIAAQGRSGNLGSMQRQAGQAGAALGIQTNQAAAQLRAGEQQAALAGYAGLGTQMQQAGAQEQLTYAGFGNQQQLAAQQLGTQYDLGRRELAMQQQQNNRQFGMGLGQLIAGGAAGAGQTAAMFMSDERLKTGIAPGGGEASEALAALGGGATFNYVPGAGPPGRRIGPMAQDMERTPAGASAVIDTPAGKAIDRDQALGLALAGASEQELRLRRIESALGTRPTDPTVGGPIQGVPIVTAGSSFKPQTMGAALGRVA